MASRLGRLASFCLIVASFFVVIVAAASAATKKQKPEEWPMNFAMVRSGDCKVTCVQWISAEGRITADTPRQFEKLLRRLKGRSLPVVFQSYGGDVVGAISVGRMIRLARLETAVGRTQLNGCPMLVPRCPEKIVKDGWSEGEVHSGGSYCFSACPLALAGGWLRAAAPTARIGLHQITNGRKKGGARIGRRDLDQISTRPDPALKRMLSVYFDEMGVNSSDVFAMMGMATPEGFYNVLSDEALRSGIITKVFSYSDEPGYVIGATDVAHPVAPLTGVIPAPSAVPLPDELMHLLQ